MVALSAREIDGFIAKPDPNRSVILVFGPDAGLVRERADALIVSAVDDVNDPFSLVRLEGDELAAEPSRLVDEAMTIPLFGGRRAIRVKAGARSFASGVETLLADPPPNCRIVIEAGELRRDAPLRALCEKAKTAAVISCYPDGTRELNKLIDDELRGANLRITPDAREELLALIGGDRQASRNEIAKLLLYARGKDEATLDDVLAIITDASALAIDPIIDGAFAGKSADVETAFAKAIAADTSAGSIMFAAQRQAALLHKARLAVEEGQSPDAVLDRSMRLHFSRRENVLNALRNLTSERLAQFMKALADANFEMRQRPQLADAIAQRALTLVAFSARQKGR
jgi:DNA polymerase III subunit delta